MIVRQWRTTSAYVAPLGTALAPSPLGSSTSIVWGNPVYDGSAAGATANWPALELTMGLAQNGMPLPPMRVELLQRVYPQDTPDYPDVPEVGTQSQSDGSVWFTAPHVTAIFKLLGTQPGSGFIGGNGNYQISFAKPGSEGSPFLTYTFTLAQSNGSGVQISISKSYGGRGAQLFYRRNDFDAGDDWGRLQCHCPRLAYWLGGGTYC